MKLVICHTNKGGAFKVANFYADAIKSKLMIKPTFIDILSIIIKCKKIDVVIFHNVGLAFKFAWLFKIFFPRVRLYNVEHYVLSLIIRHEIISPFKKFYFFLRLKINKFVGVKTITLDEYSRKNRLKILKENSLVIYNPLTDLSEEDGSKNIDKQYDLVWAGGLNSQKRWHETLPKLIELSMGGLRIAVASYDEPSSKDLTDMKEHNITFFFNCRNWMALSNNFLFTSLYEGYPLVLIEAISKNMGIIAWSPKSCEYQILKNAARYVYFSSSFDLGNVNHAIETLKGCSSGPRLSSLLERHGIDNTIMKVNEL